MTEDLLKEVAREHRRGRRLYTLTTNLDARRAVVWNMGAIAASGKPEALALFQQVMRARAVWLVLRTVLAGGGGQRTLIHGGPVCGSFVAKRVRKQLSCQFQDSATTGRNLLFAKG